MKRARRDEENVIGADVAVARLDGGALHHGEQVALHALARDIGSGGVPLAGDLVDLVDEDDAVILDPVERLVHGLVHVHQLAQLLILQNASRLGDLGAAALLLLGQHVHAATP